MPHPEIITVHRGNLATEHICCALADARCASGYAAKKQWLAEQEAGGHVFKRLAVRGKAFIEYVPAEQAWLPLEAAGYMVINCFWVSGRFKGLGNGRRLFDECLAAARSAGLNGIVAVSADTKRPFMSDPRFFRRLGFECVDAAPPFFRLWCLKLDAAAVSPRFKATAKAGRLPDRRGIVAYYSNACPFTEYWTNVVLRDYAARHAIPCVIHKIETREQAQALSIPWIINSVFYDGELLTLDLGSTKKLDALLAGVAPVS